MSGSRPEAERDSEAMLRRELARLQQRARENEFIWSGFRDIEVRMIGAESLVDVLAILAADLTALFPSVQHVSLACIDPEFDCARALGTDSSEVLIGIDRDALVSMLGSPPRPRLGGLDPLLCTQLFAHRAPAIASVALAPLVLRGRLIGSLNQGSADPHHFSPGSATDLLEHLAAVTAMCVDSALNRERLKHDGLTDPLTAIANRRFFERRLKDEFERWRRSGRAFACAVVDVDRFKQINDRYGHAAGDLALQAVARALASELRSSDVLARHGGEEFALLLPDTQCAAACAIAQRICDAVAREPVTVANERVPITVSIGLVCLPPNAGQGAASPSALLDQADKQMYRAKSAGRNRVCTGHFHFSP